MGRQEKKPPRDLAQTFPCPRRVSVTSFPKSCTHVPVTPFLGSCAHLVRMVTRPRWMRQRGESAQMASSFTIRNRGTRKKGILQTVRFDSFSILCASYWTNRLQGGSARQNPSWLKAGTAVYRPIPERCTQYRSVCFGRLSKAQVTVAQADRRSSKGAEKADGRRGPPPSGYGAAARGTAMRQPDRRRIAGTRQMGQPRVRLTAARQPYHVSRSR